MLLVDDGVGRGPFAGEIGVHPDERRHHPRILVAQALQQAHDEGRRQGRRVESAQRGLGRLGRSTANAEQLVRQHVRLQTRRPIAGDLLGRAPQVLDEDDAQRNRHGPELANLQRLYTLVRPHETDEHVAIDSAVGVRDECPGEAEHARVALEGAVGQLGQPAVEPARQVVSNLLDLLLGDVEVVEEPLVRRGDGALLAHGPLDAPIRVEQRPAVLLEPPVQVPAGSRARGHRLRGREAFRMLLETLDAEELAANELRFGCKRREQGAEWSQDERGHGSAQSADIHDPAPDGAGTVSF